jgi:hypothetical protein
MQQATKLFITLGALVPVLGCLGDGSTAGENGVGGFDYQCVSWGDPVCDGRPEAGLFDPTVGITGGQPIPARIAVGSAFGVQFFAPDRNTTVRRPVEAGSELFLQPLPGDAGFVATRAGYVALLAKDGAGGTIDLVHIEIDEPDTVVIDASRDTLALGESVLLSTRVFNAENAQLGGALEHSWTLGGDGDGILRHADTSDDDALADDQLRFEGTAEGDVEVTVSVGDNVVNTIVLRVTAPR